MNGIDRAMLLDSTKLLVDLRKEGLHARWRGQKRKIIFSAKKAVDVRWEVVRGSFPYSIQPLRVLMAKSGGTYKFTWSFETVERRSSSLRLRCPM